MTGTELSGLLEFEDGGDDGDNYDFSPPRDDWKVSTSGLDPVVKVQRGPLRSTMELRWDLALPADLEERAGRRAIPPVRADRSGG